jgi:hypothetical protein
MIELILECGLEWVFVGSITVAFILGALVQQWFMAPVAEPVPLDTAISPESVTYWKKKEAARKECVTCRE